tara:strand:- start:202 stop:972 length:771 start_codon:yes stop_codon:yes gene_type:complete
MIRSYLGYVEIIEMISRRLTKTQKSEILESYRAGDSTNLIAKNFDCTPNTINRTVKSLLTESEYNLLKKNRAKISNKNEKLDNIKTLKDEKEVLAQVNSLISLDEKVKQENSYSEDLKNNNYDIDEYNQKFDNNFEQIAPLISNFDFDLNQQKSDFEILNYESLPESVYMIVDKKVELELKSISDLPEWSFLPENELKRNAILLFVNQRAAKRICSRNQRVIKIPNTSIFHLSKSYLIAKGITRLILDDSIIGLDD